MLKKMLDYLQLLNITIKFEELENKRLKRF